MAQSRLKSTTSMSNTGYHQNGKPNWWARIGQGDDAEFLQIPWARGDQALDCIVNVPPDTTVYIGAGKGSRKTVRQTVTTTSIE